MSTLLTFQTLEVQAKGSQRGLNVVTCNESYGEIYEAN